MRNIKPVVGSRRRVGDGSVTRDRRQPRGDRMYARPRTRNAYGSGRRQVLKYALSYLLEN